jgi:phosphoribosyl 1,2-cyclic phosphate phosphodiesterase
MPLSSLNQVSTVLITHAHNDHIGGLGDLADLFFWENKTAVVYGKPGVIDELIRRFPYLRNRGTFQFNPIGRMAFSRFSIEMHEVNHGKNGLSNGVFCESAGLRSAYIPDCIDLTRSQKNLLIDLDLLVLGTPYLQEDKAMKTRSLYDVREAVSLKEECGVRRMILTHLSHEIDYVRHGRPLPPNVQFAYDGMIYPL